MFACRRRSSLGSLLLGVGLVWPASALAAAGPHLEIRPFVGSAGVKAAADGQGVTAQFNFPAGLVVDDSGNVFVADSMNNLIRKVAPDGSVGTWAGLPSTSKKVDGDAGVVQVFQPKSIARGAGGELYVGSVRSILKVMPDGRVVTLVSGTSKVVPEVNGRSNGRFGNIDGLAVDGAGNLIVTDASYIWKVTPEGTVSLLSGSYITGCVDGPAAEARFTSLAGVVVDRQGDIFVADAGSHAIRRIAPDGRVSTFSGQAGVSGRIDGPRESALFSSPSALALDQHGDLLILDRGTRTVRKLTRAGVVSTIWTIPVLPDTSGSGDDMRGLAVGVDGTLYVSRVANIQKVAADGSVATIGGTSRGWHDGTNAGASFSNIRDVAVDAEGAVWVLDTAMVPRRMNNSYVASVPAGHLRRVTPDGIVTTPLKVWAKPPFRVISKGNATARKVETDGSKIIPPLVDAVGLVVDSNGAILVADLGRSPDVYRDDDLAHGAHGIREPDAHGVEFAAIHKILPSGESVLFASPPSRAYPGQVLPSPERCAPWSAPAIDGEDNVYFLTNVLIEKDDRKRNTRIIKVTPDGRSSILWTCESGGEQQGPSVLVADASGNVYTCGKGEPLGHNAITRIAPDGTSRVIYDRQTGGGPGVVRDGANAPATTLAVDAHGELYARINDRICHVAQNGAVTPLTGPEYAKYTLNGIKRFVISPAGEFYIITGDPVVYKGVLIDGGALSKPAPVRPSKNKAAPVAPPAVSQATHDVAAPAEMRPTQPLAETPAPSPDASAPAAGQSGSLVGAVASEEPPPAAVLTLAGIAEQGWNGLGWGASLADFKIRFPSARKVAREEHDAAEVPAALKGLFANAEKIYKQLPKGAARWDDWGTGVAPETLAGVKLREVVYQFNRRGEFAAVQFLPLPGDPMAAKRALAQLFGLPRKQRVAWAVGTIEVRVKDDGTVRILNTEYDTAASP